MPILNLGAYRFVHLNDTTALRERIHELGTRHRLKGTVLLAEEGINLFVAGAERDARAWLAALRKDARFADLDVKESWSEATPFRHLRVKVKLEIIRMNSPRIAPAAGRAPSVDAATLARWLAAGRCDAGREVTLLDTRNAFEVEHGAFDGAVDWHLSKFSDFTAAARQHRDDLAGRTVVTYCTGGIRCEKAALELRELGVDHVLQLDGGILRYLEQIGGAHWHGRCFVFDERESLDERLGARAGSKDEPRHPTTPKDHHR